MKMIKEKSPLYCSYEDGCLQEFHISRPGGGGGGGGAEAPQIFYHAASVKSQLFTQLN